METKDTATEDDAEEEYLNKLGMGWEFNVLTESGVNDDTLRDSTQPDHTRYLTTDPKEGESTKITEKEIDETANESPTDDKKATNTPMEKTIQHRQCRNVEEHLCHRLPQEQC